MSHASLREAVLAANLALPRHGLVTHTWGNVSGIDSDRGVVAIKASGVSYETITAADIVLVDLESGRSLDPGRRPSTDTPTHVALYRAAPELGGIVHTHSPWATAWAQAERAIPVLGTTHADLSAESIPLTRALTAQEVSEDYEGATGAVLVETVSGRFAEVPAALVRGHGPFAWGADPDGAVQAAVTLEAVAQLALLTVVLNPAAAPLANFLCDKHYERKHGPGAYYGQR